MSHATALDSPVMKLIPDNVDGFIILDIAHGFGKWGHHIRTKKKGNPILLGLDIWTPNVEKINQTNIYDELIICDARNPPLRSRSIDIVLACEVIEHIFKHEAPAFLSEIERIHRKILVVTTPRGFMKQDPIKGNPYEQHLSSWHEKELQDRNYETKIVYMYQLYIPRQLMNNMMRIVLKWLFGIPFSTHLIIAWKNLEIS